MRNLILFTLPAVFVMGCEKPPEIQTITGFAQGTTYSVKYWVNNNANVEKDLLKQTIDQELSRLDKLMSNYRDDSLIAIFNQNKVSNIPILLDEEILDVLKVSAEVHQKSLGCYDPTIGPLFDIWGFKADKLSIPSDETIAETLGSIGYSTKLKIENNVVTKLNPNTTIGLSAIGQGYAVAKISNILEQKNIHNYLTEIGGEMLVSGHKPKDEKWRVGVERPVPNSNQISETIVVDSEKPVAIMTSGTYRHYFDKDGKRYSHILDPRTGKPVEHNSVAVTVQMEDATYADAWSTALLCLGSGVGLEVAEKHDINAVFYDVSDDSTITKQGK